MGHGDRQTSALSSDTSPEAETLQITIWRALSSVDRAQLIAGASRAVRDLAISGLRDRHPGISPDELIARFAFLTLGPALAAAVYPHSAPAREHRGV